MSTARRSLPAVLLSLASLLPAIGPARGAAAEGPGAPTPIVTVNPVVLEGAAGGKQLLLRVTAPRDGKRLPVVLFSHGAQYSKDDYLPLAEFWAANGYVVIQPTHIESLSLGLARDDARIKQAWRTRVLDMRLALDRLDEIERQAPMLRGRIDRRRVLAAGHSFGGHTTAALIGAAMPDEGVDLSDPRVLAGLMLAPPGAAPGFRNVAWKADARPALSIVGMEDVIPGFNDDWRAHADYYDRSRAGQCMAALAGVKHYLGGTLGTNRTEEKTPNVDAMAQVRRLSLAFLDAHAGQGADWEPLRRELLASRPAVIGAFECR
ncbi:MAG: alpha/beta fold hydrolase [Steroidobacteraceae bacterium]|jgi:dienelactone hydrolase|nr:alpha/beta fold hydrolase [Steroidobacteraceae bacterium]